MFWQQGIRVTKEGRGDGLKRLRSMDLKKVMRDERKSVFFIYHITCEWVFPNSQPPNHGLPACHRVHIIVPLSAHFALTISLDKPAVFKSVPFVQEDDCSRIPTSLLASGDERCQPCKIAPLSSTELRVTAYNKIKIMEVRVLSQSLGLSTPSTELS